MIQSAFTRLDQFLFWRVFARLAHYVDYRWHVNHYRLALWCLMFGLVCGIAGSFASFLPHPSWLGSIAFVVNISNVWTARGWLKSLPQASEAYERDPVTLPRAAYGFILMPMNLRGLLSAVSMNIFGLLAFPAAIFLSFGLGVQGLYLPSLMSMFYFGGMFPSGRARRPKKQRAPAFPLGPVTAR